MKDRCESCGSVIKLPKPEKGPDGKWFLKCRQCETWSDFKKQPKAMHLTPRQRAKLK